MSERESKWSLAENRGAGACELWSANRALDNHVGWLVCWAFRGPIRNQEPRASVTGTVNDTAGLPPASRKLGAISSSVMKRWSSTGNPDEPPRNSSLATKIDTPLIETPRSMSVMDRQTLDDMGAEINITQAHDYVGWRHSDG